MATLIGVMGESGSGKTTSLRNLDPASTIIVDADGKGLSWRGWRAQYSAEARNYTRLSGQDEICDLLRAVSGGAPHVRVVVIDTLNGVMVADEYARRREKGYDKWADLAWAVWDIVTVPLALRDDLTVIVTAHAQTERDESGYSFSRIKTSGRKLDKLGIETKLQALLHAKCVDGEYVLGTGVGSSESTAKTPMGLYEAQAIPSDMAQVVRDLEAYYRG
ncbi:AAA family ATPase [Eggerthellaceae bacterium zg-997]|nr:AAA family ATPase [Eggerthellaceae bacterium zg-997]